MRKLHLAIPILVVSFLIGYFWKHPTLMYHRETERGHGRVSQQASPVRESEAKKIPMFETKAEPLMEILRSGRGGRLFRHLFDGEFSKQERLTLGHVRVIRARFSRPYARDSTGLSADREAADRIGILKALGERRWRSEERDVLTSLKPFYREILARKGELIFIRREALKNLLSPHFELSEEERQALIGRTDSRVLSLARLSDRQLAEVLLEK